MILYVGTRAKEFYQLGSSLHNIGAVERGKQKSERAIFKTESDNVEYAGN